MRKNKRAGKNNMTGKKGEKNIRIMNKKREMVKKTRWWAPPGVQASLLSEGYPHLPPTGGQDIPLYPGPATLGSWASPAHDLILPTSLKVVSAFPCLKRLLFSKPSVGNSWWMFPSLVSFPVCFLDEVQERSTYSAAIFNLLFFFHTTYHLLTVFWVNIYYMSCLFFSFC